MTKLLKRAIEISCKLHNPNLQNYNVYAFIFQKKRLISIGQNNMLVQSKKAFDLGRRFNVEQFKKWPYKHAELDAISKLWGRIFIDSRVTLITVRLLKNYSVGNAKPCQDCMSIINSLGIYRLEWTK